MAASLIPNVEDLMPDVIAVRVPTAISATGVVTAYGPSEARKCYISGKVRQVRDPAGQVRVSTVKAIFAGVFNFTVLNEYTLPVRFDPRIMPAIMVEHVSDENGPHHEVVFF